MACSTLHEVESPLSEFVQAYKDTNRSPNPQDPRLLVMQKFSEFRNCRQHDAHEWILRMLEVMEGTPDVVEPFEGVWEVNVAFEDCGHTNTHDETFRTLSLHLPEHGDTHCFQNAMQSIGEPEEVASTCDTCGDGVRKDAMKTFTVKTFPRHLIVQWKRFDRRGHKMTTRIDTPFTCSPYELCGFISHRGNSVNAGHYTACTLHGSQWYLFNDHHVIAIEPRHAKKAAEVAYITMWSIAHSVSPDPTEVVGGRRGGASGNSATAVTGSKK